MDLKKIDLEKERDLRDALGEISAASGASESLLRRVFDAARSRARLDATTIYLRLRWLLSRRNEGDGDREKIELIGRKPHLSAEELAECILNPKDAVFDFIESSSSVSRRTLETIYATMLTSSTDSTGLPDLSEERMLQEMKWWILDLDFPEYYFRTTPAEEIAHQILVNRFHEIQGLDSESYRNMKISYTSPSGTVIHWVHSRAKFMEVELGIEQEYYRSGLAHDVAVYAHGSLYLYIVQHSSEAARGDDFDTSAPESFVQRNGEERLERYRSAWESIRRSGGFFVEQSRKEATGEYRVMVGFPARVVNHFMANLSRVMKRAGIEIKRKYTVAFSGASPMIVSSFYALTPFPEDLLSRIVDIGLYPDTPLARLTEAGTITPAETNFIHAVIGYVHTFITVQDPNITYLEERFPGHAGLNDLFVSVKRRMAKDLYTVDKIAETFIENPEIAKRLYALFEMKLDPKNLVPPARIEAALSSFESDLEILVSSHDALDIVACALTFIRNTIRTNFFFPIKTAMVFRLDPSFLRESDFGRSPYGVFYVRGRDFTGFHVRFGDIARGGIRILRSANFDSYRTNANSLFEECFNLAATQDKKNKDIPEKGAKGVILPNFGKDDEAGRGEAFRKYIDALLDLLLPANRELIAGYEEEILFLGPDEGTAELMNWACGRARDRGYRYWRAFTTGKHSQLGGISHIDYAMTTNGIHRYVLGILAKLGVREEEVSKLQTGGPDGDLGSNEILISRDKTICVVDGGGVIYDPAGINKTELSNLAQRREDSSHFDPRRLGTGGFQVKVNDRNVSLPDGTTVQSGLTFRNGFHLSRWMKADLFVPCGGRPKSINSANWDHLLDERGDPRVKWIVEGANLFITQEARLKLEERGVILFKDSSTNKGGVTSSSYEVLAGLALPDNEFQKEMCRSDASEAATRTDSFRERYIAEVVARINENADAEFEVLWEASRRSGTPISILSDALSERILELTEEVESSTLFDDEELTSSVLTLHFPSVLIETLGMERIRSTVPRRYLKAIFARTIARRFVYENGVEPSYETYRTFIDHLRSSPDPRATGSRRATPRRSPSQRP